MRAVLLIAALLTLGAPLSAQSTFADEIGKGQAEYRAQRYFQAIQAFEAGLKLAKSAQEKTTTREHLATAYGALGTEYFNSGETRLAEEYFEKGLQYADNYYSHFGLGYLYFQRMADDKAFEHLRSSLSRQTDFAGTHKLLALLEYRRGNTETAIASLERSARLGPGDEETKALLRHWRQEIQFSNRFEKKDTPRFHFRVDPAVESDSVQVVMREIEKARLRVEKVLGWTPERPVVVVLFDEKTFYEATGSLHWVGGLYDGQLKMPVARGKLSSGKAREALLEVIRHEYAHVAIRHIAPECPVWLNEGIAQHFEFDVDRNALARRLHERRANRLPFRQVPTRLWEVEDVDLARWTYLQGFGFVEFLVGEYREFRLRLLLVAMSEEHSVTKAFERTYGRTLEQLEEAFWADVAARGSR